MATRRTHNTYDENRVKIVRLKRKAHRCEQHIKFLSECINHDLSPAFTKFTPQQLSCVNWSPRTLHAKRMERVKLALSDQEQKFQSFKLTLSSMISELTLLFPNMNLTSFLRSCDREVRINQRPHDIKRREKLTLLKKTKPRKFTSVNVINESQVEIPVSYTHLTLPTILLV